MKKFTQQIIKPKQAEANFLFNARPPRDKWPNGKYFEVYLRNIFAFVYCVVHLVSDQCRNFSFVCHFGEL